MFALDRLRFVIVTGKGGVGKTTVAGELALQWAAQGKRVLVCMCNAKERLSEVLGSAPIGHEVVEARPNIWAVNMNPDAALMEYGQLVLKSKTLYALVFDNRYVRSFFRAVPGIQEWSMLGKAWWHTTEVGADGAPRFDAVILDAPATGHGLDMLRVPKVISEVVPPGLLRRDADRALALFRDERTTAAVVVTLLEEMPVQETVELVRALEGELALPVKHIVANMVLPTLFAEQERPLLEGAAARSGMSDESVHVVLRAARGRCMREALQRTCIARLNAELDKPLLTVPLRLPPPSHAKKVQ